MDRCFLSEVFFSGQTRWHLKKGSFLQQGFILTVHFNWLKALLSKALIIVELLLVYSELEKSVLFPFKGTVHPK